VSPLFQRQYVWGVPEFTKLWEDIDEILDRRETTRFLGALVLEIKRNGNQTNDAHPIEEQMMRRRY
jgi:uncharacterized protein with ParB-like and HNH nuclease domain